MATTWQAIRDAMITAVKGLTPAALGVKFIPHREEDDFRAWCNANEAAALRRFSIRDTGQGVDPGFSDSVLKHVERECECVIAYPTAGLGRYGARAGLSLEDVMVADAHQVENTIGTNGFQTLNNAHACVINREPRFVPLGACTYIVIPLDVTYWRAMP
jgi:hypothetical protein